MMHIHQRKIKLNRIINLWNVWKFNPVTVKLNFESIGFSILICSLNEKAAMLSNYEVYQLLQETENQSKGGSIKKKQPKHLVNLSTICYEVSHTNAMQCNAVNQKLCLRTCMHLISLELINTKLFTTGALHSILD